MKNETDKELKVIVEYRPRICSCQFFIKMSQGSPSPNDTHIEVEADQVLLKSPLGHISMVFQSAVNLVQDSLSGLHFTNNSLYFRCRTNPEKAYGSFSTELFFPTSSSSTISSYDTPAEPFVPDIEPGQPVDFLCRSCSTSILHEPFIFSRLLPLPSTTNLSEFFCHLSHGSSTSTGTNISLQPKEKDCFYGLYFVVLNSKVLLKNVDNEQINKIVVILNCSKCSSWLGLIEQSSIKLWNSTTVFQNTNKETPSKDSEVNKQIALSNFISVIKKSTGDGPAGLPGKIILTSRISSTETYYLLVWVMDKSLSLLKNDKDNSSAQVQQEQSKIIVMLKEKKVIKCLYYFSTIINEMVEKWNKLLETSTVEVSKQMLTEGLSHLEEMSTKIPEEFRTASEMNVSYIMV